MFQLPANVPCAYNANVPLRHIRVTYSSAHKWLTPPPKRVWNAFQKRFIRVSTAFQTRLSKIVKSGTKSLPLLTYDCSDCCSYADLFYGKNAASIRQTIFMLLSLAQTRLKRVWSALETRLKSVWNAFQTRLETRLGGKPIASGTVVRQNASVTWVSSTVAVEGLHCDLLCLKTTAS